MALHLGTGLIETRGPIELPQLEGLVDKVLTELGFERTYEGREAPPDETPDDSTVGFRLLANGHGVLGVEISEVRVVRDLARMISGQAEIPLLVFTTQGSLFGRRTVEVTCRKFEVRGESIEELPVMSTHTAEVTDVEHNELRQAPNALQQRIDGANQALLKAEGTAGLEPKRVLRYRRVPKKIAWSSPRLERLMQQLERCESFEFSEDRGQPVVRVELAGAKSMSYLKAGELDELERALEGRPEISRRRVD